MLLLKAVALFQHKEVNLSLITSQKIVGNVSKSSVKDIIPIAVKDYFVITFLPSSTPENFFFLLFFRVTTERWLYAEPSAGINAHTPWHFSNAIPGLYFFFGLAQRKSIKKKTDLHSLFDDKRRVKRSKEVGFTILNHGKAYESFQHLRQSQHHWQQHQGAFQVHTIFLA